MIAQRETAKLCIIKSTHRATVWNPALVTTRPVKPPVPRFHRKTMGWEEILRARQQRQAREDAA